MNRSPFARSVIQISIFCISLLTLAPYHHEQRCIAAEEAVEKAQGEQLEPARREQLILRIERLEKILVDAENKVRKKRNELSRIVDLFGSADCATLNRMQQGLLEETGLLRCAITKIQLKRVMAEAKMEAREKLQAMNEDEAHKKNKEKLKRKIETCVKQETQSAAELDQLMTQVRKYGRISIDVELLRKEIDSLDPVVERISAEIERSKLELQKIEK
jgi:hypothetical protein